MAPSPSASISTAPTVADAEATYEDIAPSREELLQRAAALGPSRMTWESIVLSPTDPILADKMQPRVRERRARFRKIVKVTLGACVAFCAFVTAASVLSSRDARASSSAASVGKTAPAVGLVPVEKLDIATNTRAASSHLVTAAKPVLAPARAWGAKRH